MKTNSPTHEEIASRAREIWEQAGHPDGRDTEIWLEAERQLNAGAPEPEAESPAHESVHASSESKGAVTLADKLESEHPVKSIVEHSISPAIHDEAVVRADLQKKEARAPQIPTKIAPKGQPAETGKPLWAKPHSS